jgi:hypothetical protein
VPNHSRGQAVSEEVGRTPTAKRYARAAECEAHDVIDRARTRQPDGWRNDTEKDAARGTRATAVLEASRDRVADVGEQWHMIPLRSFAAG